MASPTNPKPQSIDARSPWRALAIAAGLLFAALLVFMWVPKHSERGWNVNTRMDLIFAVAEQRTFSIDAFHDLAGFETEDKALFNGHYYSDKIFGLSLLGLPIYSMFGRLNDLEGAAYLLKNICSAVPGAGAAILFFLLLVRTGAPPKRAVPMTVLSVLGTMWFGYSTVFYPYSLGLCTSLGALYITFYPPAGRITIFNSAAVGFLLGYTMLCDLIFGLLVVALGVVWLLRVADQAGIVGLRAFAQMKGNRDRVAKTIIYIVVLKLFALIPLSLFLAYSHSIFGSFAIPYQYEVSDRFREGMSAGVMGVTRPRLDVLYFITIHPFRGIFFWSPIVIAGIAGCILGIKQYGKRCILGWLGLYSFAAYLLFNAGYYMWWGGWGMGPRFLIPALPFVLLGVGELVRDGKLSAFEKSPKMGTASRWIAIALGVISVAMSLPLGLYDPQIPQGNQDAVLASATWGTPLGVPQLDLLSAFYHGANVVNWPTFFVTFGAMIVLLGTGAYLAPKAIPGIQRNDFPFHTVDGSTAPPPPIPAK